MRGKAFLFSIVSLAVCLGLLIAPARAEEQKAQPYFIEEVVVKPFMAAQYEAATKEAIAMYKEYKWPWPMLTYSTEDFIYYFLYPLENFATIDEMYKTWYVMLDKFGKEKWQDLWKKMGEAHKYTRHTIYTFIPELSYIPENPRLKPDEMKFLYWGFCYVMPGKEKETEEIFKKFVSLYKSKNITSGWNAFVGGLGTEMPTYVYVEFGKSAADFWVEAEKIQEIVGQETTDLWNKTLSLMRRYEYKIGYGRPDLSYLPETEKEGNTEK